MSDIFEWLDAQEAAEAVVLTELHEEEGAAELGHREGFCRKCGENHGVAQRMSRALWQARWRPMSGQNAPEVTRRHT